MSNWKFKAYDISSQNEIQGNTILGRSYISSQGGYFDWISGNTTNLSAVAGLSNIIEDTSPELGGNLDAQSSYGIDNLIFLSSQVISSNRIYGDVNYPCDYLITKEGNTTYCRAGASGRILYSNTNSYDTFQYTINQIHDTGGTILIGPGDYYISSTIMVSGGSNTGDYITIMGCGKKSTRLYAADDVNTFQFGVSTNSYFGNVNYLHLKSMFLHGNDKNCSGVYGYCLSRSRISDMTIQYYEHFGINLRFNHTIDILDCDIRYNGNADQLSTQYPWKRLSVGGIKFGHADDSSQRYSSAGPYNLAHVLNCNLEYNLDGIWINGGSQIIIENCNIEGSKRNGIFYGCVSGGIYPYLATIKSCWFEECNNDDYSYAADIMVSGRAAPTNITIENNIFSKAANPDCEEYGVCISPKSGYESRYINIINNRFNDIEFTNIKLKNCRSVNLISNFFNSSLILENCYGVRPIDISQWGDSRVDRAFNSLNLSYPNCNGLTFYVPKPIVSTRYRFTSPITINTNNVSIIGDGPGSELYAYTGLDSNMIYCSGVSGFLLKGVSLNGNSTSLINNGLYLHNCDNCTIDNNIIYNIKSNGVVLSGCSNINLSNNLISGCDGYGLIYKTLDDSFINYNIFENNTLGNINEVS